MNKRVIWLLSAVLVMTAPAHSQVPSGPAASAIEIVDQREPGEDKEHVLSLAIWDCEYMVTRMSDKTMPTSRLQQLQAEASTGLSGVHAGEKLIVTRYAVYMNEGAQMTAAALGAALGPAGTALVRNRSAPRCSREKMHAGWFEPAEVTTNKPPIIAEVAVRFRGRDYSARAAYTPKVGTYYHPKNAQTIADRVALYAAVNRLIFMQIQRDMDAGLASP